MPKQQVIAQTQIQNNYEVSKIDDVCFGQKLRYVIPTRKLRYAIST